MNPQDFQFLSDKTIDKVMWSIEGQTANGNGSYNFSIPTEGVTQKMLLRIAVSVDGLSWYSEEMPPYAESGTSLQPLVQAQGFSAPGRVQLFLNRPEAGIIYYRVLGIKP